jgi:hypothetical protein
VDCSFYEAAADERIKGPRSDQVLQAALSHYPDQPQAGKKERVASRDACYLAAELR